MGRPKQPVSQYLKRPCSMLASQCLALGPQPWYRLPIRCLTRTTLARAALACTLPQATLLGSKVWVFAGEDAGRKALGDVHVLDLDTLTWSSPEVGAAAAWVPWAVAGAAGCV